MKQNVLLLSSMHVTAYLDNVAVYSIDKYIFPCFKSIFGCMESTFSGYIKNKFDAWSILHFPLQPNLWILDWFRFQGPVVQRLDNIIQPINRYPVDKC